MKIPVDKRDQLDLDHLYKSTSRINFFADLNFENEHDHESHTLICKKMTHLKMYKEDVLFNIGNSYVTSTPTNITFQFIIGTVGKTFYIILRGRVGVNIPSIKQLPNGETEYLLNEVSEIKAGGSFGELALLYESPRTATIKCNEDCDFAVLQKAEYKEILGMFSYYNFIYIFCVI